MSLHEVLMFCNTFAPQDRSGGEEKSHLQLLRDRLFSCVHQVWYNITLKHDWASQMRTGLLQFVLPFAEVHHQEDRTRWLVLARGRSQVQPGF